MATAKHLDNAGEEARKLCKQIADTSKDYNERRKEATASLRKALKPVWEALANGKEVNGCKDKLSWAKWANPTAKNPERFFYAVMRDKKGLKSVQPRRHDLVTLRNGLVFNPHGGDLNCDSSMPAYLVVVNDNKHGVTLKPLNEKQHLYTLELRVRPLAEQRRLDAEKEKAKAKAAA